MRIGADPVGQAVAGDGAQVQLAGAQGRAFEVVGEGQVAAGGGTDRTKAVLEVLENQAIGLQQAPGRIALRPEIAAVRPQLQPMVATGPGGAAQLVEALMKFDVAAAEAVSLEGRQDSRETAADDADRRGFRAPDYVKLSHADCL